MLGICAAALWLVPAGASADVNSDKSQVASLEQRISADGAAAQRLIVAYDQALAHQQAVQTQLDATRAKLADDQRSQAQAMSVLRTAALSSYMGNTSDGSLTVFGSGSNDVTDIAARQEYAQLATESIQNAIDAVTIDATRTAKAQAALQSEEAAATAVLRQLDGARSAAEHALATDAALLSHARSNLQVLEAALARQAAQQAAEEASLANLGSHPVNFTFNPSPGAYTNPLRAVSDLSPERVDQGVDYHGDGPIFAAGDGVVLSVYNSGWPGGTFISYRLTDGPAGGLVVYAAEDIYPSVSVGQHVDAGTVLGTVYEGPDGIETGWADGSGDGTTMAHDAGQFNGSNSTAYGANFSQMLQSLGAPGGTMQNEPPTGSLPPNWPTW
ncbi:MAG: hypothetical protein ACYDD4_13205 [Acidimicrobiales bacterium]